VGVRGHPPEPVIFGGKIFFFYLEILDFLMLRLGAGMTVPNPRINSQYQE